MREPHELTRVSATRTGWAGVNLVVEATSNRAQTSTMTSVSTSEYRQNSPLWSVVAMVVSAVAPPATKLTVDVPGGGVADEHG